MIYEVSFHISCACHGDEFPLHLDKEALPLGFSPHFRSIICTQVEFGDLDTQISRLQVISHAVSRGHKDVPFPFICVWLRVVLKSTLTLNTGQMGEARDLGQPWDVEKGNLIQSGCFVIRNSESKDCMLRWRRDDHVDDIHCHSVSRTLASWECILLV